MKKVISFMLVCLLVLATDITLTKASTTKEITVLANNKKVIFDQPPENINGRVYIPVRFVAEALDWKVWIPDKDTILLEKQELPYAYFAELNRQKETYDKRIFKRIEENKSGMNTVSEIKDISLKFKLVLKNDRLLVSIRDLAEMLDCKVDWIDESKTVVVTQNILPKPNNNGIPKNNTEDKNTPTTEKNDEVETTKENRENYATEVIKLANEERKKQGLNELVADENLMRAAQIKSDEMLELDYSQHDSPVYGSVIEFANAMGIKRSFIVENIGWNHYNPEIAVDWWLNSEGHRRNILDNEANKIGVGYSYNKKTGKSKWCMLITD